MPETENPIGRFALSYRVGRFVVTGILVAGLYTGIGADGKVVLVIADEITFWY